jgi:hypothetical protein
MLRSEWRGTEIDDLGYVAIGKRMLPGLIIAMNRPPSALSLDSSSSVCNRMRRLHPIIETSAIDQRPTT